MEIDEVVICNVWVDLLIIFFFVYLSNGEIRKEREMEVIVDDEREGGGVMVCVERRSFFVNNDIDILFVFIEMELKEVEVLVFNVLYYLMEEGEFEDGIKDV